MIDNLYDLFQALESKGEADEKVVVYIGGEGYTLNIEFVSREDDVIRIHTEIQ